MASTQVDPLQALSAAFAAPADSKEQSDLLSALREALEIHPGTIPILCTTLIKTLSGAGDSLLKRWVLDLLHFALCLSNLSIDARAQLASQSVDVLAGLLHDMNPFTVKVVVQCFGAVYPLLFRILCTNRHNRQPWDILTHVKTRILEFIWAPHVGAGVKLAALKFAQKAIVVQTRGPSDPRLQRKEDPNISMCPSDHPFISVANLEAEGLKLLESVITILYTSQNVDMLTAMLNSWPQLAKLRPTLTSVVVSTLTSWTPAALTGLPASSVKSVEKAVRILMIHLSRTPNGAPHIPQINEALAQQGYRMDKAAAEEKARRVAAAADAARKRGASATPAEAPAEKRPKLEHGTAGTGSAASFLATFDFTSLPASMVTDFIVANLQALPEEALADLVQAYRRTGPAGARPTAIAPTLTPALAAPASVATLPPASISLSTPIQAPTPTGPQTVTARQSDSPVPQKVDEVKDEPVDPLAMNIDTEELEYEPDKLNEELSGREPDEAEDEPDLAVLELQLREFKLPAPKELEEIERDALVKKSFDRMWSATDDEGPATEASLAPDLWMLLLIRLVTRVTLSADDDDDDDDGDEEAKKDENVEVDQELELYARQDRQRQIICDYIMADFPNRVRLATAWMNEEWYNDDLRSSMNPDWRPNYDTWLNQVIAAYQTQLDSKDRTFSRFLLDIPAVPPDILALVRELCVDPERREVGFTALRGFVTQRPSLRAEAMAALLDLTTHPDKMTRAAAINTVRRWVPDVAPMDGYIREFALQMLRRLRARRKPEASNGDEHDENMEDGQLPVEETLQTPYLPEQISLPAQRQEILQHVELLFALSVKVPDFLDEIFAAYGQMDGSVQETLQQLITPLIKSLGSNHGKLLTLLRTFPEGADSLALRVLTIFTEHGRPSGTLVALVKSLIAERDLDARFLIPIIAEMDKVDIVRHLPRIVAMLDGTAEKKALVRSVFSSIVATPAQTFGTVTSNLPRVRQSELLTPAELMVILHDSGRDIGLKSAIESIGVCFSMTDVFRSEVLAIVMQQIVDEPVLPTNFMRTVIQAVNTYKSLIPFVSTTLFSRLIIKKIWTNPPLWEGFGRCAKMIAPASFAILLQLPKEQLRDLVEKQPALKPGLREHVMKKAGNKARVPGFLDIFGEEENKTPAAQPDASQAVATP